MRCKEFHELIIDYLDDRVTLDERKRIESHLSTCPQCSEELASAIGTHDRITKAAQALSDKITPSPDIWLSIKSQLPVEGRTADTSWEMAKSEFQRRKEIAMKALFSKQPVWKLAAINGFVIIALVLGLTLGLPSSTIQTAYAQVEQIARDSQQVQDALGGEVVSVEAIRLQDNIGTAVCSGATGGMAAVTIDIGNKSVTDVSPLDLTQDEEQRAIDIAMNDSRVADLVDQGAVIGDIYPGYTLGYGPQGATVEILPRIMITASFDLTLGDQEWDVTVNLDEEKVQGFSEAPKVSAMMEISPEIKQRVIDIAGADPGVQELLGQGAVIDNSSVGTIFTAEEDRTLTSVHVKLELDDRTWSVVVDVLNWRVSRIREDPKDPFAGMSEEEQIEFIFKYPFGPLEVQEILDAVESDQSVRAIMLTGAEVISVRPVLDWECDTSNVSGMQQQVCHQKDGDLERVDVMLGMGVIWWDVIFDLDSQKVVEIREYSYDSSSMECHDNNNSNAVTITDEGQPVDWETDSVRLTADEFYIVADGVQYLADVQDVEVESYGYTDYCTLELRWYEHGNEMRLHVYFVSDGTYWWSNEIRTYNGQSPDSDCLDWIYYTGQFFKTKLGSPFVGDIDLTSDADNNFDGTIHFEGLELQPFLDAD